jgi:ketosteroid isomerase-like protein
VSPGSAGSRPSDQRGEDHPNVDLLRAAYEAFGNGDLGPLLGALTDDISWHDSTLGPLAGDYTGKDQVVGLFGKMMDLYGGTLRLSVVDILANDAHGVVLTREEGRPGGEPVKWTGVHLFRFRDGRCADFVAYASAEYQAFWSSEKGGLATRRQPSR